MALRRTYLATGQIYHVFNRSIGHLPIFKNQRQADHFLEATAYYLQENPPVKFSIYKSSPFTYPINLESKLVTIINYCLMPNHFHFTLRQEKDKGIKRFIQKLTNSFSHYFCLKNNYRGHLFEGNFKAELIETVEQLIHLSRYIHLNPVTSFLTEKPEDYPFSSYEAYLGHIESLIIDKSLVLDQFHSADDYKKFVNDQINYQRELDKIKHLLLEAPSDTIS